VRYSSKSQNSVQRRRTIPKAAIDELESRTDGTNSDAPAGDPAAKAARQDV
jgi:hypothetical protein